MLMSRAVAHASCVHVCCVCPAENAILQNESPSACIMTKLCMHLLQIPIIIMFLQLYKRLLLRLGFLCPSPSEKKTEQKSTIHKLPLQN